MTDVLPPVVKWKTPSRSEARIEELALLTERLAGNVSCYAGGGRYAHELRRLAEALRVGLAPLP